jgi:hypothetical protein
LRALGYGAIRNRFVSSLELAWQPSWRPGGVAHAVVHFVSRVAAHLLDSINMMACGCRVTFSILSCPPLASAFSPRRRPTLVKLMQSDCCP